MNRRNEYQGPRTQADDDHRGGNRQRVDRPYASEDDSFDSPRGSRYASNATYDYANQDFQRDHSGNARSSYYGGAQSNYDDYDAPRAQRGGWAGESQLGGGNYASGPRQPDTPSNRNARYEQPRYSGGYGDYGQRSMSGGLGQPRSDFNQAGGYGSGYSQVGNPSESLSSRGHFGRGPKGYTRSDDRIKEDISERLTDDYSLDASDISVEVRNGVVTLSGQVDERWMKHHAEDLVDRCSGVQDIENRLTINRSRGNAAAPAAAASTTPTGSTRKQ